MKALNLQDLIPGCFSIAGEGVQCSLSWFSAVQALQKHDLCCCLAPKSSVQFEHLHLPWASTPVMQCSEFLHCPPSIPTTVMAESITKPQGIGFRWSWALSTGERGIQSAQICTLFLKLLGLSWWTGCQILRLILCSFDKIWRDSGTKLSLQILLSPCFNCTQTANCYITHIWHLDPDKPLQAKI